MPPAHFPLPARANALANVIATAHVLALALVIVIAPAISAAQPAPDPAAPAAPTTDAGTPTPDASDPIAAALAADPDAPTVGASLDRSEAHLGDQLTLTITAVARAQVADTVQLARPELGRFEILDTSQTDKDLGDGRKSRRFVLQITSYQLGDLEVPAIPVEYTSPAGGGRQVKTGAIAVTIRKVVDDDSAEMQPLAHTHDAMVEDRRPIQALMALAAAGGLGLLALVVRALVRRRRKRARVAAQGPVVTRPAHEIALERLAELRRRGGFAAGGYQPFHFALAEVVRAYLGARYGFDSLELTTTELMGELEEATAAAGAQGIGRAEHGRVRVFLERCDMVKFAKAPSSDGEAGGLLDEAERIVRATMAAAVVVGDVGAGKVAHG